jgi:small GTP-binding protein
LWGIQIKNSGSLLKSHKFIFVESLDLFQRQRIRGPRFKKFIFNVARSGRSPSRKVVFLGDAGVGKTSILAFHEHGQFESVAPTTSPACIKYSFSDDKRTVLLNIWDTAGQEKFQSMTNMYVRKAFAAVLVFDITSHESFAHLSTWLGLCRSVDPSPGIYVIAGNKKDLQAQREVATNVAERFAASKNAPYLEVSAITGEGIAEVLAAVGQGVIDSLFAKGPDENVDLGLTPIDVNGPKQKCC